MRSQSPGRRAPSTRKHLRTESPDGRPARHILTLGRVDDALVAVAAEVWRADKVDDDVGATDSVMLLVDHRGVSPPDYVATLSDVHARGRPVGVIPVDGDVTPYDEVVRRLSEDTISIDFATSRFRMSVCAEANLPTAPPALRRARHDDAASVAEDLAVADLLVLQGHAGAIDAGIGRWLVLCSRSLGKPADEALYPCFGTDRCFRQQLHDREATSQAGLVDPESMRAALLVLDGCGTLPVPGSLFRYETSLARSIMASTVQAAVLTHGMTATPFSSFVAFVAALADSQTLGEAVRAANDHARASHPVPTWTLMGNPDARVTGIPLLEAKALRQGRRLAIALEGGDVPEQTGALVAVERVDAAEGPFDLECPDGRWARGVLGPDGCAHLWVAAPADVSLVRRPKHATLEWQSAAKWLQANVAWLKRAEGMVAARGGDPAALRAVGSRSWEVGELVEQVAFAARPERPRALAPSLESAANPVRDAIAALDRAAALAVGGAVPVMGARLFGLWAPPWLDAGSVEIAQRCSCSAALVGYARRHPVLELVRVLISCPGCGPLADVTAEGGTVTVTGTPADRRVERGRRVEWPVRRTARNRFDGFACSAMFDAFRSRRIVTDVVAVPAASAVEIPVDVPEDWPLGLSQVVTVVAAGTQLSFLDFDIDVCAR